MRFYSLPLIIIVLGGCVSSGVQPAPDSAAGADQLDNVWYQAAQNELAAARQQVARPEHARNVILFIGDGMSIATVTAARILAGQLNGNSGEENLLAFEKFPFVALAKTYNTNAQVPDSAGTATAMLSGVKTIMGVVGVDASVVRGDCNTLAQSSVPTLLEQAEQRGFATGVISTARITHATPASAYAHTPHRGWEATAKGGCSDIATQLVNFDHGDGPEIILGGGRGPFLPGDQADPEYGDKQGWREDGRNLVQEWLAKNGAGARFAWNKKQFDAFRPASGGRLLGLFEPGHMQYEADRNDGSDGEPSLADMVAKAIRTLDRSANGYFLLVEGGRIDHAHHAGNAYRALHDTIAMSDAVATARSLSSRDDTLIIVTADHGHVMEIAGYPKRGNPILGKVISVNSDGSPATDFSRDAAGLPYTTLVYGNGPGHVGTSDQQPAGPKTHPHSPASYDAEPGVRPDLTAIDTEHPDYLQEAAIPSSYETHSGVDVPVYADGPSAWLLQGVHEQNYIYHVMAHALFAAGRQ